MWLLRYAVVKVDLEQHYIIPKPNRLSIIIMTSCIVVSLVAMETVNLTSLLQPLLILVTMVTLAVDVSTYRYIGCYRDYQEIKVQEQVQKLTFGKISFCHHE